MTVSSVDEKQKHPKKDRKDFAFGISFTEFLVSVALGIGSGLATAAKTIRDLFHDDVKHATAFEKHFEGRQPRLDAIALKDFDKPLDYWKATRGEKAALTEEYNALALKFRGVRKSAVMGTIDRFHTLSDRSRGGLYFNGAVGAIVGAAVTLGFFNGVATRDKIDKIGDAVGANKER